MIDKPVHLINTNPVKKSIEGVVKRWPGYFQPQPVYGLFCRYL
jgi:hypothetical protein